MMMVHVHDLDSDWMSNCREQCSMTKVDNATNLVKFRHICNKTIPQFIRWTVKFQLISLATFVNCIKASEPHNSLQFGFFLGHDSLRYDYRHYALISIQYIKMTNIHRYSFEELLTFVLELFCIFWQQNWPPDDICQGIFSVIAPLLKIQSTQTKSKSFMKLYTDNGFSLSFPVVLLLWNICFQ